jgi:hypothetical protein
VLGDFAGEKYFPQSRKGAMRRISKKNTLQNLQLLRKMCVKRSD